MTTLARALLVICLLVSLAVVATGVARGTGGLQPPVVDDGITARRCPTDPAERETTLGKKDCLAQRIVRSNAKINARVKSIFGLLDDTGRRKLIVAERAWFDYRDLSCRSVADAFRGGSVQPVVYLDCLAARNDVHLKDLTAFLTQLRRR